VARQLAAKKDIHRYNNGVDDEQEGNDEVSFVGFPFGLHFNRG